MRFWPSKGHGTNAVHKGRRRGPSRQANFAHLLAGIGAAPQKTWLRHSPAGSNGPRRRASFAHLDMWDGVVVNGGDQGKSALRFGDYLDSTLGQTDASGLGSTACESREAFPGSSSSSTLWHIDAQHEQLFRAFTSLTRDARGDNPAHRPLAAGRIFVVPSLLCLYLCRAPLSLLESHVLMRSPEPKVLGPLKDVLDFLTV